MSGKRLAVKVERDGQLVGQVNADVDMPKLLATVFAKTSRERGEVPFAVGEGGELYTRTPAAKQQLEALRTSALSAGSAPGTTVLPDWIVATTTDPTGSGLKFGIARPIGDALVDLRTTSARNAALGLGFIGLALIVIVPLSAGLTRNLDSLSAGVHRIAEGDYSARVPVRSKDEIGRLAVAFNQMAADVEQHQKSAVSQERIRRELELGRQIQHDMLPQGSLMLGLTEIKGVSVPAREVGGDFFNYFQLRDGRIALLVGDVSGKGVGAALLMANLQAALRTRLALGQDLASLAQELDVDIDRTTPGPVYATLFVGILDPATRRLRCVNAGHNPQYVLRTDGRLERMESTGRPIGLLSGGDYAEQAFDVAAGDVLFFYTDGCVEAENASGDMFGIGAPRAGAGVGRGPGRRSGDGEGRSRGGALPRRRGAAGRRDDDGRQGRLTSGLSTPKRQQRAQARLPQVQPAPEHRGHVDRKQRVAQERVADADVRGDRAAEVSRHDDGAEHGRLRHEIEHQADQLDCADHGDGVLRVAERHRAFHGRCQPQQLHDRVECEEQRGERRQDVGRAALCPGGIRNRCVHGSSLHAHRSVRARAVFCIETTAVPRCGSPPAASVRCGA